MTWCPIEHDECAERCAWRMPEGCAVAVLAWRLGGGLTAPPAAEEERDGIEGCRDWEPGTFGEVGGDAQGSLRAR